VTKILVVDDDAELVALLREYLHGEGFTVAAERDGPGGVRAVLEGGIELVVLDIMLPGLGGLDVLRTIRERSTVPVVMLTARGEEVDRIVGLELGADDYLPKPFNPRELVARIRAILRRGRAPQTAGGPLIAGDLELDPGTRQVRRAGQHIELTGTEFSLLERLVREAGSIVRRDVLYREVLGRRAASFDRSLDVHLSNLRRKLGPLPSGAERITTVRGVGYQYVKPGG
jgi:DNA-binding response OmpR family regulator